MKKYTVIYKDSREYDDGGVSFDSRREAEDFIEGDLEVFKEYYVKNCIDYDYGDFCNIYGNITTVLWSEDGDGLHSWIRAWSN